MDYSQEIQVQSSMRMIYEAEVKAIKNRIGDLKAIQSLLGLSGRKICQLLMVDPSAWNRWTTGRTPVPPYVYRTLEFYLLLKDKHPGLSPMLFLPQNSVVRASSEVTKNGGTDQIFNAEMFWKFTSIVLAVVCGSLIFLLYQALRGHF